MLNPHKDAGTDVESYCGMYQIGVVVVGVKGGAVLCCGEYTPLLPSSMAAGARHAEGSQIEKRG